MSQQPPITDLLNLTTTTSLFLVSRAVRAYWSSGLTNNALLGPELIDKFPIEKHRNPSASHQDRREHPQLKPESYALFIAYLCHHLFSLDA